MQLSARYAIRTVQILHKHILNFLDPLTPYISKLCQFFYSLLQLPNNDEPLTVLIQPLYFLHDIMNSPLL